MSQSKSFKLVLAKWHNSHKYYNEYPYQNTSGKVSILCRCQFPCRKVVNSKEGSFFQTYRINSKPKITHWNFHWYPLDWHLSIAIFARNHICTMHNYDHILCCHITVCWWSLFREFIHTVVRWDAALREVLPQKHHI